VDRFIRCLFLFLFIRRNEPHGMMNCWVEASQPPCPPTPTPPFQFKRSLLPSFKSHFNPPVLYYDEKLFTGWGWATTRSLDRCVRPTYPLTAKLSGDNFTTDSFLAGECCWSNTQTDRQTFTPFNKEDSCWIFHSFFLLNKMDSPVEKKVFYCSQILFF